MVSNESGVFWLSYPDPLAKRVKMRIMIGQLDAAYGGASRAQNSICHRYKQIADLPRHLRVSWDILKQHIEPTKDELDAAEARQGLDQKIRGIRR